MLLLLLFIILESKKKVEKKVGRLWEAREAPPKIISTESENKKLGSLPCLPNLYHSLP